MAKARMTPFAKIFFTLVIVGGLYGAWWYAKNNGWLEKIMPQKTAQSVKAIKIDGKKVEPLRVCVNTWVGFAPGVYFNEGIAASSTSRYTTEYGVPVEISINDDFQASLDAWKAGKVDVICNTADVLPVIFPNIMT
ncbi:MAG: hypothetical protein Q7R33_02775, partial [Nitrosarchaeum sp.]|nr:hypothetical protein [Nitrosarchaeum sp.]